jgi:acyl carrier protein
MTEQITDNVARLVRETLALTDSALIAPENLLFYDLNFTSMDMLDLLFRLEQHFQISIPDGTIYALARGGLTDRDFAEDGILTAKGRQQLMDLLHDSPSQIFPERIHVATLPRYCTVASITRLVQHRLGRPSRA